MQADCEGHSTQIRVSFGIQIDQQFDHLIEPVFHGMCGETIV